MPESGLCSSWIEFPSADLSGSCGGGYNQMRTDKHSCSANTTAGCMSHKYFNGEDGLCRPTRQPRCLSLSNSRMPSLH